MKQKEIKLKGKDGNTYGIKFGNIDTLKKEIDGGKMLKEYTTKKIMELCEECGNDKKFMKKVWIPKEQSNK